MVFRVRVVICCLLLSSYAFSITPDSAMTLPAVFEDFLNRFGDNDKQNSFGAAKGVIENGETKAYVGGGYWYATCDGGSSIVAGDGTEIVSSNVAKAIDETERCLHVKMTTSTSEIEFPYASVGSLLTQDKEYHDVSKMKNLIVKAKGSGTVRINLITKDYLDKKADWGFYGVDIDLSATAKEITTPIADILPVPYSVGDPDGEGGWTFAKDGCGGLNKIEIQVKDGDDAEIWLYSIEFGGMTYGDCGFVKLAIGADAASHNQKNSFTITNSCINYSLARAQKVTVDLFNVMGIRVATLYNGAVDAGINMIPLNLLNSGIAAGNYLVVVTSERETISRPLMFVK